MNYAEPIPIALICAAYLWGGLPTAYLAAHAAAGIDIRQYGSGNVGASNAVVQLGAKTGVAIGLFDFVGKGILPALIARMLDQSLATQVAVGIAAVAGHNWSPFIGFTGGRGVGAAGGMVLAFGMWVEAAVCAALMVGVGRLMLKETGLLTLIALASLAPLTLALGRQPELTAMCAAFAALLIAKRLTANWEPAASGQPLLRTIVNRMLWDRDVGRRAEWTRRVPRPEPHSGDRKAASNDGTTDAALR